MLADVLRDERAQRHHAQPARNYDMSKMATDPEMQKAMQAMSDPKLQQASTNIAMWVQKNCVAGR